MITILTTCSRLYWKITRLALRSIMATFLVIAAHAADKSEKVVVVAVTAEARPMAWRDERGDLVGLNPDLARALCESAKLRCRIIDLPFGELLAGVMNGEIDIAVANLASTPERAEHMLFSRPYLRGHPIWIGRDSTDQSRNLRVATLAGAIHWDFLQAYKDERNWKPVPISTWNEIFNTLRQGKADAALVNFIVAQSFLAQRDLLAAGFTMSPVKTGALSANTAHIGVSKASNPALLPLVNATLESLNRNGKLSAITARHLPFRIN